MSLIPPTYVKRTVNCSFCGKEFKVSAWIGGDPISNMYPFPLLIPPILIPLVLFRKIFCRENNKCPHCGKTYSNEEIIPILFYK